jgi:hypothetical protein
MSARAAVLVTSSASLPALRFPAVRPAAHGLALADRRWAMLTLLWALLVVTPDLVLRAPAIDVVYCVTLLASWVLWGAVMGGLSAARLRPRARAVLSAAGALALLPTIAAAFGCLRLRWQQAPSAALTAAAEGTWAVVWNAAVAPPAVMASASLGLVLYVLSRSGGAAVDDASLAPWSPGWAWARAWSWTSTLLAIPFAVATVATVQYYLRPWF